MTASTKRPTTEGRSGRQRVRASGHSLLAGSPDVMKTFDSRPPTWLQLAKQAIKILDREERETRKAEERWARFTKKGDRRPVEAIEKGKATA